MSIARRDGLTVEISAVQREPGKFANVGYGTKIDTRSISVVPPSVQPAPDQVMLSSYSTLDQVIAQHNAVIAWSQTPSAIACQVQWRRDNSDSVKAGGVDRANIDVPNYSTACTWLACEQ